MKTKTFLTTLIIGVICQFAPQICQGQDIDSMAPVVVKTVPEAGSKDVSPGEMEIRVTFSKDMMNGSWSACQISDETFPKSGDGKMHYLPDKRTCVMPVKLEPGKTYVIWLNRGQFQAFRDTYRNSSVPYLLVFQTKK